MGTIGYRTKDEMASLTLLDPGRGVDLPPPHATAYTSKKMGETSDNFCKFLNVYLRYVKNHFPW